MDTKPQQKMKWAEVKRFVDDDLAVVIESSGGFRPRYSKRLASIRKDGKLSPFIQVRTEGSAYQAKMVPFADREAALLRQAEEWLGMEIASRVDDSLDQRIAKDTARANFGRPQTRQTGKTARNKAKRSGQAA